MDYRFQKVSKIILNGINSGKEDNYISKKEVLQLLSFKDKILIVEERKEIVILNINTFKIYSIIKMIENSGFISATKLTSTGHIACCGDNGIIFIFKIKPQICKCIQKISIFLKKQIYRIKEITNNTLISNQNEKSLIFYEYNKKKLKLTNKIMMDNYIENILPTKDNDILLYTNFFCPKYHYKILLFDAKKLKIIKEVLFCNGNSLIYEPFSFLTKNIVAIVIAQTIFLVDINKDYTVITKIESIKSNWIYTICCLDHNKFVSGDREGNLILWNYDKNIINKIGEYAFKKNYNDICTLTNLLKLKNNLFLVGGKLGLYAFNFFKENRENNEGNNNH